MRNWIAAIALAGLSAGALMSLSTTAQAQGQPKGHGKVSCVAEASAPGQKAVKGTRVEASDPNADKACKIALKQCEDRLHKAPGPKPKGARCAVVKAPKKQAPRP